MFALVLFICYLDGGCEDIVVDVYREETQCLVAMEDQRIRHGGWHAGRAENPALTPLVTDESALGQDLVTPDTHPTPHPIL